jgi:hypothetical protein
MCQLLTFGFLRREAQLLEFYKLSAYTSPLCREKDLGPIMMECNDESFAQVESKHLIAIIYEKIYICN